MESNNKSEIARIIQDRLQSGKIPILLSTLYFFLGLFLFFEVPAMNDFYRSMYQDWDTNDYILIKAFHIQGYIWFLVFCMAGTLNLILRKCIMYNGIVFNTVSIIVIALVVSHVFDWLYGFVFCHPWGCNLNLPTWGLFS